MMTGDKEVQQIKKRLLELAERSDRQGIYTFTNFLSLAGQQVFQECRRELEYAGCGMDGGAPVCERKVVRFGLPQELGYEEEYPIACLKIKPVMEKYAEELTHRDVLGAIMSLGIEREMVGDIFFEGKSAYVFCMETVAPYISGELEQIRHTRVLCERSSVPQQLSDPHLEEISLAVSSGRIDGVLSKLYHLSRSASLELFRTGKIFVNGRQTENNSYMLKPEDAVTVRGFGKFLYAGEQGETRKGKLRVLVRVYG